MLANEIKRKEGIFNLFDLINNKRANASLLI